MAAPHEITSLQLLRRIDTAIDRDFADNPFLNPGSVRHRHIDLAGLGARLRDRPCAVTGLRPKVNRIA